MKNGPYELIKAPEGYPGKKYRGRYAYEHIINWWTSNGMPPVGYEIHHINGNHRDNRIKNLQLVTGEEHRKIHGEMRKVKPIFIKCDECGKKRSIFLREYNWKLYSGQKYFFCSSRCGAIKQHKLGGKLR